MPVNPTYPGVYIEEIRSSVHTITGVSTSIAAFIGYTSRGRDHHATRIFSFADFERLFGGLASDSELSYAVRHFFNNGGSEAYIVRVPKSDAVAAIIVLKDGIGGAAVQDLQATGLSKGAWGNGVILDVDYDNIPTADTQGFNLTLTDLATGAVETFDGVTIDKTKSNYVMNVINDDSGSKLITLSLPGGVVSSNRPAETGTSGGDMKLATITDKKKAYVINATVTVPVPGAAAIPAFKVTFVEVDEAPPGSTLGACRLLERKLNTAIANAALTNAELKGVTAICVPNRNGKGIRVHVMNPNVLDSSITFAAVGGLGASEADADAALNLAVGTPTANVAHYWLGKGTVTLGQIAPIAGSDGTILPKSPELMGSPTAFTGIYALDKVDLFNILCIPDATRAVPSDPNKLDAPNVDPNTIFDEAITYCKKRRAFLLIDAPPDVNDVATATDWKSSKLTVHDSNAAAYFPRLRLPDPLNNSQLRTFAPCGVVAGLYARMDAGRGVWKAPAGTETTLTGVQGVAYKLTDPENGALNPLGLNCFRIFPIYGAVAWGARTLVGADAQASEWKYIPVRRLALYMEESLFRGTQWVVFEPNDEPLWAQIRLNVGAFMHTLFRQGAFQGSTPRDAYFVKCDKETTTQDDINRGVVNILVGFAPLKPAEFVIIQIQQIAGQIQV